MKHLLNYEILQEYGFVWASANDYGGKKIVDSYIKQDSSETDAHNFRPISLQMFYHPNFHSQWIMSYCIDKPDTIHTLFRGRIGNDKALKQILESCVVFKPSKK